MLYVGSIVMVVRGSWCAGGHANSSGGFSGREANVESDTDKAVWANDISQLHIFSQSLPSM